MSAILDYLGNNQRNLSSDCRNGFLMTINLVFDASITSLALSSAKLSEKAQTRYLGFGGHLGYSLPFFLHKLRDHRQTIFQ